MKTTNYNIRLNPMIKTKAEETFAEFGLNLSEAINVFLHMSIKKHGFPFEVVNPTPNELLKNSFDEAEAMLADPNIKTYSTIEDLNSALMLADEGDGYNV